MERATRSISTRERGLVIRMRGRRARSTTTRIRAPGRTSREPCIRLGDTAATARGYSSDREKKVKLAKEAREEWTDPTTGLLKYPNTQRTVKNHRRNIALSDLALTTTQHTPNGSKMKGPARRNMMTMTYNSMSDEQQETRWGDQAERRYVDLEAQIANYRLADASEKNPKKRKKNAKGAGRDPETRKASDRRARQQ